MCVLRPERLASGLFAQLGDVVAVFHREWRPALPTVPITFARLNGVGH